MKRKGLTLALLVAGTLISGIVLATPLDKIHFIKVSPKEAFAVIKGVDGKLITIKPGDTVAANVTVKEIIPGSIVLEEITAIGIETLIVTVDGGKNRIERTKRIPESRAGVPPVNNGK